jgi:hypothetical protein
MLTLAGDRIKTVSEDGSVTLDRGYVSLDLSNSWCVMYPRLDMGDKPDPRDPATIGCMIEVLQRATGCVVSLLFNAAAQTWLLRFFSQQDVNQREVEGPTVGDVFLAAFESLETS